MEGGAKMATLMYRDAINQAMIEEMKKDGKLFLIGYDVGKYGGEFQLSHDMYNMFGEDRVRDAPISEQGIIGCAIGAAITGCRAIADIPFSDFMAMCMDQVVNQAAKFHYMFAGQAKVPIVIMTAIGGFIQAGPQHSQSLEGWFTSVPGLKTVAPGTAYDAKGLMKTAIADPNPVVFVTHKALYAMKGEVPEKEYTIPLGVADIKKKGRDVSLFTYSLMVHKSLSVANKLEKEGISVEVVDLRTLYPLDKKAILQSLKKTGRAVIVHEAPTTGGFGGEIAAVIADEGFGDLKAPVKRVGAKWAVLPFVSALENEILPGEDDIEGAIREALKS
jgi:pyruvate/2-oxoglutarate/acetoin dehydrogenase E1 component